MKIGPLFTNFTLKRPFSQLHKSNHTCGRREQWMGPVNFLGLCSPAHQEMKRCLFDADYSTLPVNPARTSRAKFKVMPHTPHYFGFLLWIGLERCCLPPGWWLTGTCGVRWQVAEGLARNAGPASCTGLMARNSRELGHQPMLPSEASVWPGCIPSVELVLLLSKLWQCKTLVSLEVQG